MFAFDVLYLNGEVKLTKHNFPKRLIIYVVVDNVATSSTKGKVVVKFQDSPREISVSGVDQ